MRLITDIKLIDQLRESPLKTYIRARFKMLSADSDIPPTIVLVEEEDDVTGPDYAFVNETRGLLGDLYDHHKPGEEGFTSPFEWISRWPELKIWEALYLEFDMGTWLIIPDQVVDPELRLALTAQKLSNPQPL